MDGFDVFSVLVVIVICVLNIILFFKVWGMTNNISGIRILLEDSFKNRNDGNNKECVKQQFEDKKIADEERLKIYNELNENLKREFLEWCDEVKGKEKMYDHEKSKYITCEEYVKKHYSNVVKSFEPKYASLGLCVPKFLANLTLKDKDFIRKSV